MACSRYQPSADSYQYQLQSMWQKCWNTNQSLVHNLRFRERGPLKSWRPETMAEAIFSVLKEGLSLSQAARKYDIPYPTFVLYANRVHNMLGPSVDGSADLRPKGRGRPQRILLGTWPEEHIRGVIRAVVFRDTQHIKEEPHLGYGRIPEPLGVQNYSTSACSNGPEPTVSPGAAAAAAVAVVAQGLRQQMCSMVAAAQHQHSAEASLVNSLGLVGHSLPTNGTGHGMPPLGLPSPLGAGTNMRVPSPVGSAGDLRTGSPSGSPGNVDGPTPISSPLSSMAVGGSLNSVELGIGVSGMTYKPTSSFTSPRPENLFQEDIEDIVKSPQLGSPDSLIKEPKESLTVKVEPVMEGQKE